MTETKPDTKGPNCERPKVVDDTRENQSGTTHVLIPSCVESNDTYYRITILDADSSSPTAIVHCGQEVPKVN